MTQTDEHQDRATTHFITLTNRYPVPLAGRVMAPLQRVARRDGRREYECMFMQPGWVRREDMTDSNILIPAATIEAGAHLFDSVSVYLDHPEMFGFGWRQSPQVKHLAGVTFNPRWSAEENALLGSIRLYDLEPGSPGAFMGYLLDQILADEEAGKEVPPVGLSAVVFTDSEIDEESGTRIFTQFRYVQSVDFVYTPGAAGYVRAALDAMSLSDMTRASGRSGRFVHIPSIGGEHPQTPQGGNSMTQVSTQSDGGEGRQAQPAPEAPAAMPQDEAAARVEAVLARLEARLNSQPEAAPPGSDSLAALQAQDFGELSRAVERLTELVAEQERPRTIRDVGQQVLYVKHNDLDQYKLALDALLAGQRPPDGIPPLSGIREAYTILTGDWEMNGVFQPDRVHLAAVTTTTMAGLVANALNKRVVNAFQEYDQWWAPAVTVMDFSSLQDVRWITLGGVGELPTVSEGAAYTELTWDDQTETDSFVKKGGYLGITLETIDKDDTGRVMAAPRALAQAAWLTLGKSISAIFTDNSGTGPAMSDSNYLFDAGNHGNLLTAALSFSEWDTVKIAMMKQTEVNSGERLGALTRPYLLWVPIDLETTALQILASEGEPGTADNDINPFAQGEGREARLARARQRVIVCPLWTDTNNWAAQADPRLYPSIGLGFRYGRTPEIFSVASPTGGLMFSNDTLPIKVRFFYAVGPTDWRGLHKSNVS